MLGEVDFDFVRAVDVFAFCTHFEHLVLAVEDELEAHRPGLEIPFGIARKVQFNGQWSGKRDSCTNLVWSAQRRQFVWPCPV